MRIAARTKAPCDERRVVSEATERRSDSTKPRFFADVPGAKKEDIDVTLENGILTITAETKSEKEEKEGERVLRQERRYGKYVRSLRLGTQIDEKGVKANYKDGVLELTLPKAEEVKPKKITVDVA